MNTDRWMKNPAVGYTLVPAIFAFGVVYSSFSFVMPFGLAGVVYAITGWMRPSFSTSLKTVLSLHLGLAIWLLISVATVVPLTLMITAESIVAGIVFFALFFRPSPVPLCAVAVLHGLQLTRVIARFSDPAFVDYREGLAANGIFDCAIVVLCVSLMILDRHTAWGGSRPGLTDTTA